MISGLRERFARIVALLGCSAGLIACEAVPTEEDVINKELVGKVSVGIRPIENELLPTEPMQVLFYLNNATDAAITILPWATPLETNMTADRFLISFNGEEVPYSGRVVKRPAPRAEDFITLVAGEKKETVVSLADGYDVSGSGNYEISLRSFVFQNPDGEFLTPTLVDQVVAITRK